VFPVFFTAMRDTFAAMLGADWDGETDAAWRDLLARIDAALRKN
jgi:hypothetical protein